MPMLTPSGRRIAREAQLLGEEKWLVDTLKKIRTQRNCLQIERLQLENMLTMVKYGPTTKKVDTQPVSPLQTPTSSVITEDSHSSKAVSDSFDHLSAYTATTYKTDETKKLDEEVSNFEELNLTVTNPVWSNFRNSLNANLNIEEEEEESDHEEDNVDIDMNMFMNSDQGKDIHMDS